MGANMLDFAGRWVVVSGASSGLGRACAEELTAHGARVILVGRSAEKLERASRSLSGTDHRLLVLDLSALPRIGAEIARVTQGTGRLYGLVHAAGLVETRPLSTTTHDIVQQMMTVNLLGGLELARAVTRRDVMDAEGGSLVFLSSVYGRVGVAGETGYSATKGAVAAAVRAMAIELARRRVRVNTISPGFVRTPMTDTALEVMSPEQIAAIEQKHPLGPGTTGDVARAAVFLLSPAAAWITGVDLAVDGGYSAQ